MVMAARRIGVNRAARGGVNTASPMGFCASPDGGEIATGHRASQPAVEFDPLQDRECLWLVETEHGLSAGAVCRTGTQPGGVGVQEHLLESQTAGDFDHGMKPTAKTPARR